MHVHITGGKCHPIAIIEESESIRSLITCIVVQI
jgi:hypothetical protein